MKCVDIIDRLDDFVDGVLPRDDRDAVQRHLDDCPTCRRERAALENLLAEAQALPREMAPDRDLWAGVAERIGVSGSARPDGGGVLPFEPPRPNTAPARKKTNWTALAGFAAAAAVLIAVFGSFMTLTGGTSTDRTPSPQSQTVPENDFLRMEEEYRNAKTDLMNSIEARETGLDPETVTTIRENLQLIEGAIVDIHAAIKNDPSNRGLNDMLLAMYEQEIDFLEQASRLPIGPPDAADED